MQTLASQKDVEPAEKNNFQVPRRPFPRQSPTHHDKLRRLVEDFPPQFESGRGWEQIDLFSYSMFFIYLGTS